MQTSSGRSRVSLGVLSLIFAFWGGGWSLPSAQAGTGELFNLEAHDLLLMVDSRWAGTYQGGYYPIRIQVENHGADCLLTLRFTPYPEQQLPTVERRDLQIASGGKALVTLSVPLVGRGAVGWLEVERDGELLEGIKRQIVLAPSDHRSDRSSILILAEDPVQTSAMEQGLKGHRMETPVSLDLQILRPQMLPSSWIDYTGLEMVMTSMKILANLDTDRRSAILNWVQTGGILVVYDVGEPANASKELQALLNLPPSAEWQPANTLDRGNQNFDLPQAEPGQAPPTNWNIPNAEWNVSEDTFAYQDYLLGRVYGFPENPFPGTRVDWEWWLASVPADLNHWETRMGVLPRRANENFFNFLIPGVTSVPIYAFLVLMTLFTIVIGPLNYFLLRRRKRTYLLLLTIPVIAFFTSLTLFVYSTLAYGFDVASRTRSLTVLDQRTNTAVSISRLSLFAGLAPSEGLSFSPNTAVYPIWAPLQFGQSQFESGRIVWGEQQKLTDGWLRSRTRTQFLTTQHRTERGRLEVENSSGSRLKISNGTEWDIAGIFWVDEAGNSFVGGELGAGNTGELELVSEAEFERQLAPFHTLLQTNQELEFPSDIEARNQPALGIMETRIQEFLKIKPQGNRIFRFLDGVPGPLENAPRIIPKRSYLAVLANRPEIELGLEETDERAGYHLLLGHY